MGGLPTPQGLSHRTGVVVPSHPYAGFLGATPGWLETTGTFGETSQFMIGQIFACYWLLTVLTLSILIRKGGKFFAVKTYFEADPTT